MKNQFTLLMDEMQGAYEDKVSPDRKRIEDEYYDACFSIEETNQASERCKKAKLALENLKDRMSAVARIEAKVSELVNNTICNKNVARVFRESEDANNYMFEVLKKFEHNWSVGTQKFYLDKQSSSDPFKPLRFVEFNVQILKNGKKEYYPTKLGTQKVSITVESYDEIVSYDSSKIKPFVKKLCEENNLRYDESSYTGYCFEK
jgi:hypothetical protein